MSLLDFIPALAISFTGKPLNSRQVKELTDNEKKSIIAKLKEIGKEVTNEKIKDINSKMIQLLEAKGELDTKKIWELRNELASMNTKTTNESAQRFDILKVILPVISQYTSKSSKNVLKYEASGDEKYPEKHSFFSPSLQETTNDLSLVTIPDVDNPTGEQIEKFCKEFKGEYSDIRGLSRYIQKQCAAIEAEDTIEKAFLKLEEEVSEDFISPNAFTHRLGKDSTYDKKDRDFEVLFITGSKGQFDNKLEFIFESRLIV